MASYAPRPRRPRNAPANSPGRARLARLIVALLAIGPLTATLGAIVDAPALAHTGATTAALALELALPLTAAFTALDLRATRLADREAPDRR